MTQIIGTLVAYLEEADENEKEELLRRALALLNAEYQRYRYAPLIVEDAEPLQRVRPAQRTYVCDPPIPCVPMSGLETRSVDPKSFGPKVKTTI